MWRSAARVQRKVPVERHVEHARPLLVGHVDDGRGAAEPGVVDEHVDRARRSATAASKSRCTSASTRDVAERSPAAASPTMRARARSAASPRRRSCTSLSDDARALFGAALGGREADAGAGGGGDERRSCPSRSCVRGGYGGTGAFTVRLRLRGLGRQAERALADDVALDLVRAGVDRVGAAEEEEALQRVELVRAPRRRLAPRRRARPSPARRGRGARWPSRASRSSPRGRSSPAAARASACAAR